MNMSRKITYSILAVLIVLLIGCVAFMASEKNPSHPRTKEELWDAIVEIRDNKDYDRLRELIYPPCLEKMQAEKDLDSGILDKTIKRIVEMKGVLLDFKTVPFVITDVPASICT